MEQRNNCHDKKRKRPLPSPFRIKTGAIVALRYRSHGNQILRINQLKPEAEVEPSSSAAIYTEVWTDPQPGREEGMALIGRRMRGAFSKHIMEAKNCKGAPAATTRVIEGEIIALLDNNTAQHADTTIQQRQSRQTPGIRVQLLVNKAILLEIPMLKRTDCQVDQIPINELERKRHGYEQLIRGKDKVVVHVCLADIRKIATNKRRTLPTLTTTDAAVAVAVTDELMVAQWKIKKRLSVHTGATFDLDSRRFIGELNGNDATTKKKRQQILQTQFVGDHSDPPHAQERNWRWMASRAAELGIMPRSNEEGFLGEVLTVEPQQKGDTLAMVTLRRLILPEQTLTGRRQHHGKNDIYDLEGDMAGPFQVPIEELVIVYRKFQRLQYGPSKCNFECKSSTIPVIQHIYSEKENLLKPLYSIYGNADCSGVKICHRCRISNLSNGKQICTECTQLIRPYRNVFGTTLFDACDCKDCRRKITERTELILRTNLLKANDILDGEEIKNKEEDREMSAVCCICCLSCTTGVQCDMCPVVMHHHCFLWGGLVDGKNPEETLCRSCSFEVQSDDIHGEESLAKAVSLSKAMCPIDFDLPANFMDSYLLPTPLSKAVTVTKTIKAVLPMTTNGKRRGRRPTKSVKTDIGDVRDSLQSPNGKRRGRSLKKEKCVPESQSRKEPSSLALPCDDDEKFKPNCSRTHEYDPILRRFTGIPKHQSINVLYEKPDTRRNHRKHGEDECDDDKRATGRAARASQRRVLKDFAKFGSSSMELDALAGRESQLRFDRSGIHAWGVFADADINAGEMVVEYRGVLIGNAMAEKREKEYEHAKIGSDYMFRIDSLIVCDATKHGNVARFVNASCDPNCYTKIITIDGTKRIVIYAKKDVNAGEEVTYDYKFPLEYSEEKRIPCHCGTKECRGFMNWDKRYVTISLKPTDVTDSPSSIPQRQASMS